MSLRGVFFIDSDENGMVEIRSDGPVMREDMVKIGMGVDDREPQEAHPARRRTERRMVPHDILGGSAGRDGEGVLEDVGSEGGSGEWLKNQKQPILVL